MLLNIEEKNIMVIALLFCFASPIRRLLSGFDFPWDGVSLDKVAYHLNLDRNINLKCSKTVPKLPLGRY